LRHKKLEINSFQVLDLWHHLLESQPTCSFVVSPLASPAYFYSHDKHPENFIRQWRQSDAQEI
jgi:hypothetical protein